MNAETIEAVATAPLATLPAPAVMTPMQMLQVAVDKGVDTEQLKMLMELQREWKADRAREAFIEAMSAFRATPMRVMKDKQVRFEKTGGGVTEYKHATLAAVVDAVVVNLSNNGLSHRWETKQDGALITVSCVLMHSLGHSERVTLSAAPDQSGGKNSIQAVGSTVSYLQRYTLMAITGLAAADQDKDGKQPASTVITEKQAADLDALIDEVGADRDAFLKVCGIESLEHLPIAKYQGALKRLEAKRVKQ